MLSPAPVLALIAALVAAGAEARGRDVRLASADIVVQDGDTLIVDGIAVRLMGAHAPELRQPGGHAARQWMIEHTRGQTIVCRLSGARSYGRRVGVCRNAAGDLAAQLIAAGLGRDCPRFSSGRYAGQETEAGRRLKLPAYCQPR
jgi:endonuclease YncB( thermonuclease family)